MIEVCREFQRGKCSREADECRYAHPPAHVLVENGHVTACFDSLKDQCTRESCKYLHPPKLVKEELQASSRAFSQTQTALQQLCNPLMFQQQALCTSQNMISPWGIMIPSVMPFSFQPTAVMIPEVPCSGGRRKDKSDKLEVCREYQRSQCPRGNDECKYAHPEAHIHPDPADNMVTVCMDYMKERCEREACRYFHPPPHLQARVKANQLNASSLMAAAAQSQALALGGPTVGAATTSTPTSSPGSAASGVPPPPPPPLPALPAPSLSTLQNMSNMSAGMGAGMYGLPGMPGLSGLGGGAMAGLGAMGGMQGLQSYYGSLGSQLYQAPSAASYGLVPDMSGGIPKDSFTRSSMLAQMAAETAVLTNRKRKMMDQMTYPEMVKRQAMTASLGGSAPNSLMASPWNMSQQLALQGALAAGGIAGGLGGAQPLQLANSLALNPGALMHQQAAVPYATYAMPVSSAYGVIPGPFNSTQTVAQATTTPTAQ